MDKKTVGIIATVVSALLCGCCALFACIWGILIATETPFDTTVNGIDSVQTFPPTFGYVLLCLSVIFILTPIIIGFITLRKPKGEAGVVDVKPVSAPAPVKPQKPEDNDPLPPAS